MSTKLWFSMSSFDFLKVIIMIDLITHLMMMIFIQWRQFSISISFIYLVEWSPITILIDKISLIVLTRTLIVLSRWLLRVGWSFGHCIFTYRISSYTFIYNCSTTLLMHIIISIIISYFSLVWLYCFIRNFLWRFLFLNSWRRIFQRFLLILQEKIL